MKRYITSPYHRTKIDEIEVLRETDKCYFVEDKWRKNERRHLKDTDYHESWGEAHSYLLLRATRELESARYRVSVAESDLAAVKAMKQ